MKETFFIVGIIIILFSLFINYRDKKERKKVLNNNMERPKLKEDEYIAQLIQKGFEKEHVEVFYNETKKIIGIENYTMYPEDDIYENYGLWDLDDIELVDNVCRELGIRKAEQKDFDELGKTFNKTNAESILTLIKMLKKNTEYNNTKT